MNDTSKMIIRLVHVLNSVLGGVKAAYTFDAGPNAVIYTTEEVTCAINVMIIIIIIIMIIIIMINTI
jgi:mevalonate pyrophosphate decarboxylase